jgi:hypothetical protein
VQVFAAAPGGERGKRNIGNIPILVKELATPWNLASEKLAHWVTYKRYTHA